MQARNSVKEVTAEVVEVTKQAAARTVIHLDLAPDSAAVVGLPWFVVELLGREYPKLTTILHPS